MQIFCKYLNERRAFNQQKMSSLRATFNLQSIGYYPRGKAVYITVTSVTSSQKVSIILDRTEENLSKLSAIIRDQKHTIELVLDTSSKTFITDKEGRDIARVRATSIGEPCEASSAKFFSQISN